VDEQVHADRSAGSTLGSQPQADDLEACCAALLAEVAATG
jgi:hypothetical protein